MTSEPMLSRRTLLRGVGATISLPFLDAMLPRGVFASTTNTIVKPPVRFGVIYVPNGVHMQAFTPKKKGKDFDLPELLQTVAPYQGDFSVLSGLTCDKARANGDGPGDHARAMSAFLTCRQPKKTSGADIRIGTSVDQMIAGVVGKETKLPSLEIGIERGLNSGGCDSGYSCAYSNNMSWRSETLPMPKEIDPKAVFDRLFGVSNGDNVKRSILDTVMDDANNLKKKVGGTDQKKLDEYLTSIRELEERLQRNANSHKKDAPKGVTKPSGIPKEYAEHLKAMADLYVLAFQTDVTRVGTFAFANEGSNRSYKFMGVPEGHHDLSHHGEDKEKHEKIQKINKFHMEHLAYIIGKMKGIKEADGSTLLDNMMLMYGSGIGDGNRHNHDNLPILLFGKGGGHLNPGQHIEFPKETPIADLYIAFMQKFGMNVKTFGDSKGVAIKNI